MRHVRLPIVVALLVMPWSVSIPAAQEPALPRITLTPAQMEEFLLHAKIVRTRPAGSGVTNSLRVTLSDGTLTHDAQIQTVDQSKSIFKPDWSDPEFNFTDSYRFNIVGYRLALLLGLALALAPLGAWVCIWGSFAMLTSARNYLHYARTSLADACCFISDFDRESLDLTASELSAGKLSSEAVRKIERHYQNQSSPLTEQEPKDPWPLHVLVCPLVYAVMANHQRANWRLPSTVVPVVPESIAMTRSAMARHPNPPPPVRLPPCRVGGLEPDQDLGLDPADPGDPDRLAPPCTLIGIAPELGLARVRRVKSRKSGGPDLRGLRRKSPPGSSKGSTVLPVRSLPSPARTAILAATRLTELMGFDPSTSRPGRDSDRPPRGRWPI